MPLDGKPVDPREFEFDPQPPAQLFDSPATGDYVAQLVDAKTGRVLFQFGYSFDDLEHAEWGGQIVRWKVNKGDDSERPIYSSITKFKKDEK